MSKLNIIIKKHNAIVKNYEGTNDYGHLLIQLRLFLPVSWQKNLNYERLANTLLTLRPEIRARALSKKQLKGLTYTHLVDLMEPGEREGTKRKYTRLMHSLHKEGFLITENKRIKNIGPRLFDSERLNQFSESLYSLYGAHSAEGRAIVRYMAAPFHVDLTNSRPIAFTQSQVLVIVKWMHNEVCKKNLGRKELERQSRQIIDYMSATIFIKLVRGSRGKPAFYVLRETHVAATRTAWEKSIIRPET